MATKQNRIPGEAPPGILLRLWNYLDPALLIVLAILEFVKTTFRIIFVEWSPSSLFDFEEVRNRAFSDFWLHISSPPPEPNSNKPPPPLVGPLSMMAPYFPSMKGVVLDLGPGTGHLTYYYPSSSISAIYGAEPNVNFHPTMLANARAAGMEGKYHALACGAEASSLVPALKKAGLLPEGGDGDEVLGEGVLDVIIAGRVLCGVPDLKHTLKTLYALLKPGGQLLLAEHVVNPWWKDTARGGFVGRALQVLYKPFWEALVRCRIDADTETLIEEVGQEMGGWESVDLVARCEWNVLAWVGGRVVKKK